MIPVTTFAGKKVAVFGLGGSGLVERERASRRRRRRRRLRRRCAERRQGQRRRHPHGGFARHRLVEDRRACARARRSADPSGAALGRRARANSRGRSDRRHRAVLPRAPKHRAGCALRRHHRHQRQIDDDGAGRPSRGFGRHGRAAWRQYRHRDPVAGAAARQPGPTGARSRHRVLVLSDRSRALARSLGRHPDQSQRRSSRSPRHDGALRGGQGAPRRRRAGGWHRDRRRR